MIVFASDSVATCLKDLVFNKGHHAAVADLRKLLGILDEKLVSERKIVDTMERYSQSFTFLGRVGYKKIRLQITTVDDLKFVVLVNYKEEVIVVEDVLSRAEKLNA